jgi:hypothetical protein
MLAGPEDVVAEQIAAVKARVVDVGGAHGDERAAGVVDQVEPPMIGAGLEGGEAEHGGRKRGNKSETLSAIVSEEQARCHTLGSRHLGAAADPGPLIRRALPEMRLVQSSILERNVFSIGDVLAL